MEEVLPWRGVQKDCGNRHGVTMTSPTEITEGSTEHGSFELGIEG